MNSPSNTDAVSLGAKIWRHIKLILGVVLLSIVLIFATQNADAVTVRFLAWRFELSQSLLIFFVLTIGMIAGAFTAGWLRWTRSQR